MTINTNIGIYRTKQHMKILVTGAAGFIGYALAQSLVKAGHKVTGIDRNPFKLHDAECIMKDVQIYMNELKTLNKLPIIQDLMVEPIEPFDLIIHLAATARVGISLEQPEQVIANNIGTTLQVLSYAREVPGTKVMFISSSSVAFADLEKNPYAMSKSMCEDLVNTYSKSFNVDATTVRLFNVYGPGEANYGKHSTFIRKCRTAVETGSSIVVYGDGSQTRDYTHVDDVVKGIQIISELAEWEELYELGSGKNPTSTGEIARTFADALGVEVKYERPRQGDPKMTKANPARNPPGWKPKWTVQEYLDEVIASYKRTRLINSSAS